MSTGRIWLLGHSLQTTTQEPGAWASKPRGSDAFCSPSRTGELTVLSQTPWLDLGEGNKERGMERARKGKELEEEEKERDKVRGNGNWGRGLHH